MTGPAPLPRTGPSAAVRFAALVVAPDGVVVAREGVPTPRWLGGAISGGTFVCIPGHPPRRAVQP